MSKIAGLTPNYEAPYFIHKKRMYNSEGHNWPQGTDINLAINDLLPDGGWVWVPPGITTVAARVDPIDNLTLLGAGRSTILRAADGLNDHVIGPSATRENVVLKRFKIDGNYANQDQVANDRLHGIGAIGGNALSRSLIEELWITQCSRMGIELEFSVDTIIKKVRFNDGAGDDDVSISNGCMGIRIDSCISENHHDRHPSTPRPSCFEIEDGAFNTVLTNCIARDSDTEGEINGFTVKCHDGQPSVVDVDFIGCEAWNILSRGFMIGDATGVRVTDIDLIGCKSINTGDNALRISQADKVHVIGGTYRQSAVHGIRVEYSKDVIIDGPTVELNNSNGLMIYSSQKIEVKGGTYKNNATGGGNFSGIEVDDDGETASEDIIIALIHAYDDQEPKTQRYGIRLDSLAEKIKVVDNDLIDNLTGGMVVAGTCLVTEFYNNRGYNPRGRLNNPYPAGAGYIIDSAAAQQFPTSNTNYTIGQSPKFITIYGGTVTSISIDGTATGLTAGSFYLTPGQIFNVVWTGEPGSRVYRL